MLIYSYPHRKVVELHCLNFEDDYKTLNKVKHRTNVTYIITKLRSLEAMKSWQGMRQKISNYASVEWTEIVQYTFDFRKDLSLSAIYFCTTSLVLYILRLFGITSNESFQTEGNGMTNEYDAIEIGLQFDSFHTN